MKKTFIILSLLFLTVNSAFCQTQSKGENLKIDWPDEYKWKIGSNQENDAEHLIELVPGNESIDNWQTLGTMLSLKKITNVPINTVPQMMLDQALKSAPESKLTVYEKDDQAKYPWIIFKIESPQFTNNPTPESELYYVIQGQTALYDNFVAIKEKILPDDFVKKWIKVFKASEVVNN